MLTAGLASAREKSPTPSTTSIPAWVSRYGLTAAPLERYRRRVRATAVIAGVSGAAALLSLMAWIVATNGTPLIAGIPSAAIVIVAAGLSLWLLRVGAQLPHLREWRACRKGGFDAFAIGTFPLSRTYLVIDTSGIAIVRGRSHPVGRVPWKGIEVVVLTSSRAGVGLSMSVGHEWYDLPIVLEVGGANASAYSSSPIGARRRLLQAVRSAIEPHAPVSVISQYPPAAADS